MKFRVHPIFVVLLVSCIPLLSNAEEEAAVFKSLEIPMLHTNATSTTEVASTTLGDELVELELSTSSRESIGTTSATTTIDSSASSTPEEKKKPKEIVVVGSTVRMQGGSTTTSTTTSKFVATTSSVTVEPVSVGVAGVTEIEATTTKNAPVLPVEKLVPEKVETWSDLDQFAESVALVDDNVQEIKITDEKVAINYESEVKLLGFFPVTLTQEISIDLKKNKNIQPKVKVRFPWWHIFTRKDKELHALTEELQTGLDTEVATEQDEVRKAKILQVVNKTLQVK